ncbi:hypothetical protein JMN32_10190 [Fulvivirga sp. 29W222]|uniref:Uncharacterized protein n=1 Tax=Fulvivirga marina TaxID=2494733 RepID=A0A937FXQ3_9BACT|nr:hypothetical protein [Fulvivirga marina]MBL6446682.1 hypothetical protein [Fulvivirga marina]
MEEDINSLLSKGRQVLIQMAWDLVSEKQNEFRILPEDYEASVWSNQQEVRVKFRRLIRYIPESRYLEYDISVCLMSRKVSPFDDWFYQNNFFVPDKEQRKAIIYLKGLLKLPFPFMNHEIYEDDDHYYVNTNNKTAFRHYIVNKKSGELSEPLEGTYLVLPELFSDDGEFGEESKWMEVK